MTLPASRPITLGQVCTEFGAPATTHLGAFLRGGSYVPNTAGNAGVPTSLPITLGDLLGASAATGLSVSLNRTSLSGIRVGAGSVTTLQSVTATPSGGTPGYTYFWQYVSGSVITNPTAQTSATTQFSCTLTASSGQTETSVWKCTVTDAASGTANSANVTVTLSN